MDLDELERKTHEQIRMLQEEYQQRLAPLQKILLDIHNCRPRPVMLSQAQAGEFQRWNGVSLTEAYCKKQLPQNCPKR